MRLPSVPALDLPGGYRWAQREVEDHVWQAHLLKHPLGINAIRRTPSLPWNDEGWDTLDPPPIIEASRMALASEISTITADKKRCEVRELRGGGSNSTRLECYACEPPILSRCRDRVAKEALPARYAAETERLVRAVSDGVEIKRKSLSLRLLAALKRPHIWDGLVVMSVGFERKTPVVRVSDADGFRTELYIQGAVLRWRTTYRSVVAPRTNDRFSWVLDAPQPAPKLSLSEVYVVPRDWFARHAT